LLGPGRCPLCGAEPGDRKATRATKPVAVPTDAYQARIRELREQLKELKQGGAEAV
jgi:ribosomal protein L19E